jgi:hypothetical protein
VYLRDFERPFGIIHRTRIQQFIANLLDVGKGSDHTIANDPLLGLAAGKQVKLSHGLTDEHLDAPDGDRTGGSGLLKQKGVEGIIDGIEDHHAGAEIVR